MHWTGFEFTKPRKSDLEQLNEKQRECAALQHEISRLRLGVAQVVARLHSESPQYDDYAPVDDLEKLLA